MFTRTLLLALILAYCQGVTLNGDVDDVDLFCGLGEFKNTTQQPPVCQKCRPGTFMNETRHNYQSCYLCTPYHVSIDHVLELEPCTPERDTVLKKCERGFYVFKHDSLTYKYECRPCDLNDCQVSGDCCDLENTTASMPPNISTHGKELTTPPQLVTSLQTPNSTRCENIPVDSRGCFPEVFVNKTCLKSMSQLVLCQNCRRFLQSNVTVCSPQKSTESEETTISTGEIAAIIISSLTVIILVVSYVCFRKQWYKKCSRIYNKIKPNKPKDAPTETGVPLLNISNINEQRNQNEHSCMV